MASVDVTVRGAGIFGLSVAYACARRGARVRVVDPRGPGGGASGGIVGALAPHTPENWNPKKAFQLDSLLMAEAFWADVATRSGLDPVYGRHGRLQPVADGRALDLARTREQGAARLWQGRAVWRLLRREDAGAFAPETATGWLIEDTLSARLHPRRACAALAGAIAALGGDILTEAETEGAEVLATGWEGLAALGEAFERTVGAGVKGQALLLDYAAPDTPQLFADGLHIIPHSDGTTAVGSTSERDFDDPTATDSQIDALHARAIAVCPPLAGALLLERWAGVRPRARSRAPMLGAYPGRPGVFIANGGFKIGFGMAPKVGEVMADLVLEGRDAIPDGFRVADNL